MKTLRRIRLPVGVTLAALLTTGIASAEVLRFDVVMDTAQEVPPCGGGSGSGTAEVILNDVTGSVSVTGSYTGLSGTQSLAHIHGPAPPGATAPPIITLAGSGGMSGTLTGGGTLTAGEVAAMKGGLHYINIHSSTCGPGEIRGQILNGVKVPAFGLTALAGLGALLAASGGVIVFRSRKKRTA